MVDLATWANLAEILGAGAVVSGMGYALFQVKQFRQQRKDMAAQQIAEMFATLEWSRCIGLVWSLPDDADPARLMADPVRGPAATCVAGTWSAVGYMIHLKTLSVAQFAEFQGGSIVTCWVKLRRWVDLVRADPAAADSFQWFERLARDVDAAMGLGVFADGPGPAQTGADDVRPRAATP